MNETTMENEAPFIPEPEISIWIDKYDDVFSEFDSRPFSDRALSDDFLREVRKITSEKTTGEIKLKFHVMEDQRNEESESIIINNLNKHFLHIAEVLKNEAKQDLHRGYILLGLGSALILFLFYLTTIPGEEMPYMSGIHLMLEPVGWFMTWTGLDHVFQISRKGKSTLDFNKRMSVAKIAFSSFEASEAGHQKTVIPIDNQNLRVA